MSASPSRSDARGTVSLPTTSLALQGPRSLFRYVPGALAPPGPPAKTAARTTVAISFLLCSAAFCSPRGIHAKKTGHPCPVIKTKKIRNVPPAVERPAGPPHGSKAGLSSSAVEATSRAKCTRPRSGASLTPPEGRGRSGTFRKFETCVGAAEELARPTEELTRPSGSLEDFADILSAAFRSSTSRNEEDPVQMQGGRH